MAKQKSLTTLKNKADKLFRDYIKLRDHKCQKCEKSNCRLDTAHIISRGVHKVRYDPDNALLLCSDCHLNFAHKRPLEFAVFIYNYLGKEKYYSLIERSHQVIMPKKRQFYIECIDTLLGEIDLIKHLEE